VAQPDITLFFQAASQDERAAERALKQLSGSWKNGYAAMFLDILRLLRVPDAGEQAEPGANSRQRLIRFLEEETEKQFGTLDQWRRWTWSLPYDPHPDYAVFKGRLHRLIDPRMSEFFPQKPPPVIRLDQVEWGGVRVNSIPPLDHSKVIAAGEAKYLEDGNIVFGVVINGEARAYPKRILAWHELARDGLGGVELAIVYCTLCGAVIPYDSTLEGKHYTFGTSGFLYRSNKLMFDEETKSLWSSLYGRPVVGPLAGSRIKLRKYPVVTTSWGEWRATHPETTVLSSETGHQRDYREGAAYRRYFGTDDLMFPVPEKDERLSNKDEVLALPFTVQESPQEDARPLAISVDHLVKNNLLQMERQGRRFIIFTSPGGASRVYESGNHSFSKWLDAKKVQDREGRVWEVTEAALLCEDKSVSQLARLPAHRAFWFAWHAQHPDTELIK
jgi:hypothetical protein